MIKLFAKKFISLIYNIIIRIKYNTVKIGYGCRIVFETKFGGYNSISNYSTFGGYLGSNSYIGQNCSIRARIGKYCSIANNVNTITGLHPTNRFVSTSPVFFSLDKKNGNTYVNKQKFKEVALFEGEMSSLIIANDVWIGQGASFIGNIKIGDGAVIAANATVTSDVEPYSIVGGVPARLIRKRFEEKQIEFLLNFKWWDKSEEWIEEHADDFDDIDLFIVKMNQRK